MKYKLKQLTGSFQKYYNSADIELKYAALKDVIIALYSLCGAEDLRQFAAEFIGSCGHIYDVKEVERLMKEFRLTVGPAYKIIPK